jgi:sucrose phosphorylase
MKNHAHLITYVDRLTGGSFADVGALLAGPLAGAFGGVHLLPFFDPIDDADAGFDPTDHARVDPRLGSWDDVRMLASGTEIMADVIVNHISRRSPQFSDFDARGRESRYAGMFLTYADVFPDGARDTDLLAIHTPRPGLPFVQHRTAQGQNVLLWTSFTSEQIDLNVHHPETRRYLDAVLTQLAAAGVRSIRADAVGFAVKKAGTRCFMIHETFAFIADLLERAHALGMQVLVELHGNHHEQREVAKLVDWVYDFALPPLVLHTLYTQDATALARWIAVRPINAVTVLDTHDGIGVADAAELLTPGEIDAVGRTIHDRSAGESRLASGTAASNLDAHHINCTFYDALGAKDADYLVARAIQCFLPGVPQIYYVGLLAGRNDVGLLRRTGVGRDINRHRYTLDEVHEQLQRPVVQKLLALLRFRNRHAAFNGVFDLHASARSLTMTWKSEETWATLAIDLNAMSATITASTENARGVETLWR